MFKNKKLSFKLGWVFLDDKQAAIRSTPYDILTHHDKMAPYNEYAAVTFSNIPQALRFARTIHHRSTRLYLCAGSGFFVQGAHGNTAWAKRRIIASLECSQLIRLYVARIIFLLAGELQNDPRKNLWMGSTLFNEDMLIAGAFTESWVSDTPGLRPQDRQRWWIKQLLIEYPLSFTRWDNWPQRLEQHPR